MSIKTVSRRHFLQGVGGSLVPVPFLSSLATKVEAADFANGPTKFVSIRSIYGQLPQIFYPQERPSAQIGSNAYYRAFSQGEKVSTIIGESFRPVAHKLSLLRGIDNAWGGHNHCTMLAPSAYNEETEGDPELSTSMDELLARSSLYSSTPAFRILRLEPNRTGFGYSWFNGARQPYDSNMDAVLTKLFRSNLAGDTGQVDAEVLQALKAVDIAKPGYDNLRSSTKISAEDATRLNDYMDMLNDLESKLEIMKNFSSCEPPSINTSDKSSQHDAAIDLTIAALMCGLTRVASISMATWGSVPGENGSSFHEPSHWTFGGGSSLRRETSDGPDYLAVSPGSADEQKFIRFYSFVSDKVGKLMSKMDAVSDSNGNSLLDNSIVYWGNEQSGGSAHGRSSMPILVGGTANGKLTPGYWDFTRRPFAFYAGRTDNRLAVGSVPYSNFLTTLLTAMGLNRSEWESVNGQAGFGRFKGQSYGYQDSKTGGQYNDDVAYNGFMHTDENKRKTVPYWFNPNA